MQKYFHILLVLLINYVLIGCATDSKKDGILEQRADYNSTLEKKEVQTNVRRTKGKVKKAWLHAHEMPTGDYFGGAWVYLLVEETKWDFSENLSGGNSGN